jgi:multidrug transporter EmrE-like cation transporter
LFPVAAAVGVGLGTFSILADGILPGRLFVMLGNIAAPWGLAAFLVGRLTTSLRRGALAGGLALVVGVAVYYLGVALRGYDVGPANAVWTAVALVAGPIMGLCGAATAARPSRPPIAAVVLPERCSSPRRSSCWSTGRRGAGTSPRSRTGSSSSGSTWCS